MWKLHYHYRTQFSWLRIPWASGLSQLCSLAAKTADSAGFRGPVSPFLLGNFRSSLHKDLAVLEKTRQELVEAYTLSQLQRREADCYIDRSHFADFPIHRMLPCESNQTPLFVNLRDGIQRSKGLRRIWSNWAALESINSWLEVTHEDVCNFVEDTIPTVGSYQHLFSAPLSLSDEWYRTLVHTFHVDFHMCTDPLSTTVRHFSSLTPQHQFLGATMHPLNANTFTRALLLPDISHRQLKSILTSTTTFETLSNSVHHPTIFDKQAFSRHVQLASLVLQANHTASVLLLCPDELLECLEPLQQACPHATCIAENCDVPLMSNISGLNFACPTASFWLFSHSVNIHFDLTRLHTDFGQHLKSCHGILKKRRLSPLSVPASVCSKHFVDEFQKEVEIRRAALHPHVKQSPTGKFYWWQKPRRDWQAVYRSWDRVNSILHFAPFSWVRKIAALRRVHPSTSVLRDGVWIYVLWCIKTGAVYFGQTGARSGPRGVGLRGKEHILCGIDIGSVLQDLHDGTGPRNLYLALQKLGVEHFVITPFMRVCTNSADAAEFHCMNLWGTRALLNTVKPSCARSQRWLWLLRRSAWKHERTVSAVSEMRLQATTLKHSRRLTLNLSDLLHFLISARAVLPPSEFRDVFDHVSPRMWLHYDLKLPYQICFAIPLLTPPLKNRLQTVFSDLVRNAPLPLPVKEYIISALRIVGCRTPTIGSLLLDGAMKMPIYGL